MMLSVIREYLALQHGCNAACCSSLQLCNILDIKLCIC